MVGMVVLTLMESSFVKVSGERNYALILHVSDSPSHFKADPQMCVRLNILS